MALDMDQVENGQTRVRGPLLQLVLRRGITYWWGLRIASAWPRAKRMLTPEPVVCLVPDAGDQLAAIRPRYAGALMWDRCLSESYTSCFFHMARTAAARRRAMVSCARLGFVPASRRRW